jgi:hypothetical protein
VGGFPDGPVAKTASRTRMFRVKTAQVSVFCVPVVVPLLQARLQLHQANSDDRCSNGNADQQQRSHLLKPPKPFVCKTFICDKKFITDGAQTFDIRAKSGPLHRPLNLAGGGLVQPDRHQSGLGRHPGQLAG